MLLSHTMHIKLWEQFLLVLHLSEHHYKSDYVYFFNFISTVSVCVRALVWNFITQKRGCHRSCDHFHALLFWKPCCLFGPHVHFLWYSNHKGTEATLKELKRPPNLLLLHSTEEKDTHYCVVLWLWRLLAVRAWEWRRDLGLQRKIRYWFLIFNDMAMATGVPFLNKLVSSSSS